MYKITLADGTVLNDIRVNATTFISQTPIDPSIMTEANLAPTIIERVGDELDSFDMGMVVTGEHHNMRYYEAGKPEGEEGYYFALVDIPEEELVMSKMYADIQYLAMMTDTEL